MVFRFSTEARCLVATLAIAVGAPHARAGEPPLVDPMVPAEAAPSVSQDARERAEAWIREGVALRIEGRESEALERFRRAHVVYPSPRALGQMGLAAKSLRLYVDAERYLNGALAEPADPWVSQNREALELAQAIVAKQLASLVVRSSASGAELWINGKRVAVLPLSEPVRVLAGSVLVELRVDGRRAAETTAQLAAGSTGEVVLHLEPTRPNADASPPESTWVIPPPQAPAPSASPLRPWIYSTLVVGAAGVGAGTVFGAMALSAKGERDEVCPDQPCPTLEGVSLDEDTRAYATASTVAFTVGASALVASLVLWIVEVPTPQPNESAIRIVFVAQPAAALLVAEGTL